VAGPILEENGEGESPGPACRPMMMMLSGAVYLLEGVIGSFFPRVKTLALIVRRRRRQGTLEASFWKLCRMLKPSFWGPSTILTSRVSKKTIDMRFYYYEYQSKG